MGKLIGVPDTEKEVEQLGPYRCATCMAWEPQPDKPMGKCRFKSPLAHVIPIPVSTIQGQGTQLNVITAWPETTPTDFCFDHIENEPENALN